MKLIKPSDNKEQWPRHAVKSVEARKRDLADPPVFSAAQLAAIASAAPLTPDQLDRLVKRGEK